MEVGFGFDVPGWLILITTVIALLYIYVDRKFRYWNGQGIESQTKLDFIKETIAAFKRPFHENLVRMYTKHGKIYGTCFPVPQLWISEPELLKCILVKDFHIFRNRAKFEFGDPLLDKMITVQVDDDWKRIRSLISPTFTSGRMRKMTELVKQCAESLAKSFREKAEEEEFDCKKLVSLFTIDVIASTAFATKLNAQGNENHEFVKNARTITNRDVSKLTLFIFVIAPKLFRYLKFELFPKKIMNYFRNVVLTILEERKERNVRGGDFLQLMIDAQEGALETNSENLKVVSNDIKDQIQLKHKTMTPDEVVAQCILFFIAGHDTTTIALSYFCYQMALNPEWQEKLLKEIDETWEKYGDIDFDTLSKMTYLDATLNETLRLQGPGGLLSREAAENYILPNTGIKIKKGMAVIIPIHGMHHDPEWFPEPEKFNPERFLPENKSSIPPYTYMPFGDGPRNCIAVRYITMVMKMGIVYFLRDLRLVATDETRKPLQYYSGHGHQAKEIVLKVEKRAKY